MKRTMLTLVVVMGILLCACQKEDQSESSAEAYVGSESAANPFDLDANLEASAERETLSHGETADHVAVNCLVDNPSFGDERNFIRIIPYNEDGLIDLTTAASGEFTFEPGQRYGIVVYAHNVADPELGDDALARGIGSTISFPERINKNEEAQLSCIVSYQNGAETEFISCAMSIRATADIGFGVAKTGTIMNFDGQSQSECPIWITASDNVVAMSCVPGGDLLPGLDNSSYMIYFVEAVAK